MDSAIQNDRVVCVSYLVASYNHEKYITDCLNSILRDCCKNDEIIVVDDGSTDNSVELIRKWIGSHSDEILIKFVSRDNRGISSTLNELMDISQGQFLRIVASDDMILPGTTHLMRDMLNTSERALAVVGDVKTINERGDLISESQMSRLGVSPDIYKQDLKRAIISKWAICGPAILFKQGFREKVGRYDEALVVEDWSMYLRLVAADALIFFPEKVAYYRVHSSNTSLTRDISKRLANLRSQRAAGQSAISLFSSSHRVFLKAEVRLIDAKMFFLEKSFFLCAVSLSFFGFLWMIGNLERSLCGGIKTGKS